VWQDQTCPQRERFKITMIEKQPLDVFFSLIPKEYLQKFLKNNKRNRGIKQ
jgi:hypothetical protein